MKHIVYIVITILIILIGSGIGYLYLTHKETPEPVVQTPVVTEEKIQEKTELYELTASYPINSPVTPILKTFVEETFTSFKANQDFENWTEEDKEIMGYGDGRIMSLELTYKTYSSPLYVSYVYTIYENTFGAHPNAYNRTFTFTKDTNEIITLEQLFEAPESVYLQNLTTIAREQLIETLGENANMEYLEDGTKPTPENFQHFYLEGDTITFIFPPYQVGPWAIGTQSISFPYSAEAFLSN